ncbi:MAG: hypothetical protein ABIL09_11770 [Gemmatimonadota bacterium]
MRRTRTDRILAALRPEESAQVLARLVHEHTELRGEVEQIARALLGGVDHLEVAGRLEGLICGMDLDELYAGAGRSIGGYVEPTEAVWRNLEEQVEPFLDDIRRRAALGLEDAAREYCKGVVLGLYRLEYGPDWDGHGDAPDWAAEMAGEAVRIWRVTRRPSATSAQRSRGALPRAFVRACTPEWSRML